MDFTKLNPWNWFKKEDEQEKSMPVQMEKAAEKQAPPPSTLAGVHTEIDRVFNEFFRGVGFGLPQLGMPAFGRLSGSVLKPSVDISGSEKEYAISVELPGVEEKDIHLELKDDALVIRAEKRQEEKSEGGGYYRVERSYGAFQRVFALPQDADGESIKAKYKNGIVTITIPRKAPPESKSKRIALN
jgi:HSP20 family protein